MATTDNRRLSDRIDIELPVVLTRDDTVSKRHFEFRAPAETRNIGPGGYLPPAPTSSRWVPCSP